MVGSVSDCEEFFLEGSPPEIPGILESGTVTTGERYKVICQLFNNKRRFVTLYDINNKIPVFSAYVYRGQNVRGRPKIKWMIEPQVSLHSRVLRPNHNKLSKFSFLFVAGRH